MKGIKFIQERNEAIKLRKKGLSIVEIEAKLKINRSTLFGWIKDIKLGKTQRIRFLKHRYKRLLIARQKSIQWHNAQKAKRLEIARIDAKAVLENINMKNKNILELALAMLYWGEGFKHSIETGLGNSDPQMLSFFILILRKIYLVPVEKLRCELYLRADQDIVKIKNFWARQLKIPLKNFRYVSLDQRTKGSATYKNYRGVCAVRCGNVAIQRKLANISKLFVEKLLRV